MNGLWVGLRPFPLLIHLPRTPNPFISRLPRGPANDLYTLLFQILVMGKKVGNLFKLLMRNVLQVLKSSVERILLHHRQNLVVGLPLIPHLEDAVASLSVELTVEDVFFNFKFNKTSAEQGAKAQVLVGVEVVRAFEGTADVTLVGLPAGVTCTAPTQTITAETTEVTFPIDIAADARAGNHKTLVCQAVVHSPGGDIGQTEGTAELQIDVPLPAPTQPAPAPAAAPAVEQPKVEAPPRPLTRIEQLRLDRQKKINQ